MTIATIRRVPVDLILHSLAERFKDSAEEGHDRLAMGLYACIDSNGLAEEWAVSGGVAQAAEWMATIIDGRDSWREPTAAETRVAEVAVCKRILATACNLCVTQDAEDHTAATALMQAASRILGVGTGESNAFVRGLLRSCAEEAAKHTGEELTVYAAEQAGVIGAALRKLAADALAKEGFRAEMHAAVGREMEMRKQVVAMQDANAINAKRWDTLCRTLGIDQTADPPVSLLDFVAPYSHAAQEVTRMNLDKSTGTLGGLLAGLSGHIGIITAERDDMKSTVDTLWPILSIGRNTLIASARIVKARMDAAESIINHISAIMGDPAGDLPAHVKALATERNEAIKQRDACYAQREETARIAQTYVSDALDGQRKAKDELVVSEEARKMVIAERDTAIKRKAEVLAELGETRALCHHHEKTASDAIKQRDAHAATIENLRRIIREAAAPVDKLRPQHGDVVPWAEVEDGALYHRPGESCPFRMSIGGRVGSMYGADDRDILRMVAGTFCAGGPEFENHTPEHPMVLVARDLGSDPEAWRKAMREWTENGNKPRAR